MLALKITDQKNFTNKLFLGDTFDLFWLNQAEIITSNVFSIDGKLQTDFFDNNEQEFLASSHRTFSLWKEVKPFCYSVIRGKKAPLSFKIVLQFSPNKTAALLQSSAFSLSPELITGLYHRQKRCLRRIKDQYTDILRHQIDHRKGIKVDQKDRCALSA